MQRAARTLAPSLLCVALACAALCCAGRRQPPAPVARDPESQRTLASGAVVGGTGRYGGHAWLGIPFAKPPVGAQRWRAPQPPEPWPGTRDALAFGPSCMQFASPLGGNPDAKDGEPTGSEDCLTLNVFAPRFAPDAVPKGDARLPVMLWIHGGGNSIGSASFYEGSRLATEQQVIVVTTQYRLGPFGWFRHPALAGAGASDDDRSGNFGTLDLVRALEWLRDNAPAFGGDPARVTIFGESAGGANVVTLLLTPRARGLFSRAIVESGGARTVPAADASNYADDAQPGLSSSASEALLRMLQGEGLAQDRAAAKGKADAMSAEDLAAFARGVSAERVLGAYRENRVVGSMISMPRLIADGSVLPAGSPVEVFATRGRWNAVPTLLGTNRDEMKLFLSMSPDFVRRWAVLPYLRDAAGYERVARYQSRSWKANGADELAAAMTAAGAPVWVYRFDWDEEPKILWSDFSRIVGAAHGMEIAFVFGHFELGRLGRVLYGEENAPGREALSAQMRGYWGEFARHGAPGRGTDGKALEWAAWSGAPGGQFIVLDTPAGGGLQMSREVETTRKLVAEVQGDASFAGDEERCKVLAGMAQRSVSWSESDYAALPLCAAWPIARQ